MDWGLVPGDGLRSVSKHVHVFGMCACMCMA